MIKYGVKRISGTGEGVDQQVPKGREPQGTVSSGRPWGRNGGPRWERVERHALRATENSKGTLARGGEPTGACDRWQTQKPAGAPARRQKWHFGECPEPASAEYTYQPWGPGGQLAGAKQLIPTQQPVPRWLKNAKDGVMWAFAWNVINEPRCNSTLLAPSPCTPHSTEVPALRSQVSERIHGQSH